MNLAATALRYILRLVLTSATLALVVSTAPQSQAGPPEKPLLSLTSDAVGDLDLAVSPDGRTGYLATPRGRIQVLDLSRGRVMSEIVIGSGILTDLQISADGRTLVMTELEFPSFSRPYPGCGTNLVPSCAPSQNTGATYLKRVDTSSLTVLSSMLVRNEPRELLLSVSPSGTRAWLTDLATEGSLQSGLLEVVDLVPGTLIGQVPIPAGARSMAMSAAGELLVAGFAGPTGNGLILVDTSTAQVRGSVDLVAMQPQAIALSPDASRILVTADPLDSGAALLGIDPASGATVYTTELGDVNVGELILDAPRQLALVLLNEPDPRGNSKVSVVDLRSRQPRAVLTIKGTAQSMTTSDGTGGSLVASYTPNSDDTYQVMVSKVQPASRLASIASVRVTTATGTATVRWRAVNAARAGIIGYTVTSSTSRAGCQTRRTSCRITGLTPGQSEEFTVTGTAGRIFGPAATSARVRIR